MNGEEVQGSHWLVCCVVGASGRKGKVGEEEHNIHRHFLFLSYPVPLIPISSSIRKRPAFCQNLIHTHVETTMKPWILLLMLLTYELVMFLPVLGSIKNKLLCRWCGQGGQGGGCFVQAWGVLYN